MEPLIDMQQLLLERGKTKHGNKNVAAQFPVMIR